MTPIKRSSTLILTKLSGLTVLLAIAFGSVNCTAVGAGVGAGVGSARQPVTTPSHISIIQTERDEFGTQQAKSEPMSVAGHMLVGGLAGFALDVAAIAAMGHLLKNANYECDGVAHC